MEYFVGYLIKGELDKYYKNISSELSEKFDLINISKSIPPHITLKIPFIPTDISNFESYIINISKKYKPFNINFNKISFFDGKRMTIFLEPEINESSGVFINIVNELNSYEKNPEEAFVPTHFHMTLARFVPKDVFPEVFKYIKKKQSSYILPFDNITIFKKESDIWEVYKTFPIVL